MRRETTIATITVIAIALVAFQFWNAQRPASDAPPLPPLVRDLPKDVKLAERAFDGRVRSRFPTGTPDVVVVKELLAEGFRVEKGGGGWRSATLKRTIYPCDVVWLVRWRVGDAMKVAETKAIRGLNCP